MQEPMVSAVEMAREAGVCRKKFRRFLRRERFAWHALNDRWMVPKDGPQHDQMRRVLAKLIAEGA